MKNILPQGLSAPARGYVHVYDHHFQSSSSLKPLAQSKPNFMWSLLGKKERKSIKMVQATQTRLRPCPYIGKPSTIFSRSGSPMILKLGMLHQGLKLYKVYISDDPGLTLTYLTARSNWVAYTFEWEKHHLMGENSKQRTKLTE